ncbi:6-phosphogluconolactonase [Marinobacter sp. C2H3]|uniref:6-phosphogluconolactonase n=1 Tax=Marinobacter sp. C2H3 TaxID=3119003 RepID=UPI00300F7243
MPDLALPEGVRWHTGESPQAVAHDLADTVAGVLRARLERPGRASLAVSGGSTPLPFFETLARAGLDWSRVDVMLADERWVPEDNPASNTALVRRHLLQGPASAARYLNLKQPGQTPAEGLAAVNAELSQASWPLDVLVLGMGNDGHTASLFPDAPELAPALDPKGAERVAAMNPRSQAEARITLTRPVLAAAGFTALHLKGRDKLETLGRALAAPADESDMPIRAFLRPGLTIYWSE